MWTHQGREMTLTGTVNKKPLTDAAIKALKPRTVRYYVSDGRGLWLEVFPNGWSWRGGIGISSKGKAEKVALGKYPEMTLKAARQKRDELASMVASGQSPAVQKQLVKVALANTTTMREFGERYFKDIVLRNVKDPKNLRRWLDKRGAFRRWGRSPARHYGSGRASNRLS